MRNSPPGDTVPADVARASLDHAKKVGRDAVLIDTAGRMQDNEPLMRALSKLVTLNNPDLVLFVGEALVGNEAVDQVSGFNQALAEYSASKQPRLSGSTTSSLGSSASSFEADVRINTMKQLSLIHI